jgi:hypothetical protein
MDTSKLVNGHYAFDGYTNTRLEFNNISSLWHMTLLDDPLVNATIEASNYYPIGTNVWRVVSTEFTDDITLSMNSCDDSKDYNCYDGSCISIHTRYIHNINPLKPMIMHKRYSCNSGVMELLIATMVQMSGNAAKLMFLNFISKKYLLDQ